MDSLIHNWMSTHYNHQGLQETIDSLRFKKVTSNFDNPETEKEEVASEWKRLANFMSKRK